MARVLVGGGRLVAIEPDWETLVVSGEDVDLDRRIVHTASIEDTATAGSDAAFPRS
jgi:hypothetical protein